jgi:SnoaL-like domain
MSVRIDSSDPYPKGHPMQEIVERYIDCWNEADPGRRRELIDSLWAADGSYTDPLADVRGRDQIDAVMAAAQQQFPGLVFTLGGPVDANHNQARFSWHLGPRGGEPIVIGFDVLVLDGGDQIRSVHGFLDKVPAA